MPLNGKIKLLLHRSLDVMIERSQQEIASATAEIDEAAHAGLVPQLEHDDPGAPGLARSATALLLLGLAVFVVVARDRVRPEPAQ